MTESTPTERPSPRPTPEILAHRTDRVPAPTPGTHGNRENAHRAAETAVPAPKTSPANGQTMSGASALVKSLEALDVEVIFGIPGGAILPAYDPLFDSTVRHILVRHEQGAGHAATGYAQ